MKFDVRAAGPYRRPIELAYHAGLSLSARRALLLEWASEVNALPADPLGRREPRSGALATLDEVREALSLLEEEIVRRGATLDNVLAARPKSLSASSPEPPLRRRGAPGRRPATPALNVN